MLAAQQAGERRLASFYIDRFPPDVRKAYDAWLAQKPFENPQTDPHPFVPNLYELRGAREAAGEASAKADKKSAGNRAPPAITAGQYLANTVLFAAIALLCQRVRKV